MKRYGLLEGKKLNYEKLLCFPQMCGYLMKSFLCKKKYTFFLVLLRAFIAENFCDQLEKKNICFDSQSDCLSVYEILWPIVTFTISTASMQSSC